MKVPFSKELTILLIAATLVTSSSCSESKKTVLEQDEDEQQKKEKDDNGEYVNPQQLYVYDKEKDTYTYYRDVVQPQTDNQIMVVHTGGGYIPYIGMHYYPMFWGSNPTSTRISSISSGSSFGRVSISSTRSGSSFGYSGRSTSSFGGSSVRGFSGIS